LPSPNVGALEPCLLFIYLRLYLWILDSGLHWNRARGHYGNGSAWKPCDKGRAVYRPIHPKSHLELWEIQYGGERWLIASANWKPVTGTPAENSHVKKNTLLSYFAFRFANSLKLVLGLNYGNHATVMLRKYFNKKIT